MAPGRTRTRSGRLYGRGSRPFQGDILCPLHRSGEGRAGRWQAGRGLPFQADVLEIRQHRSTVGGAVPSAGQGQERLEPGRGARQGRSAGQVRGGAEDTVASARAVEVDLGRPGYQEPGRVAESCASRHLVAEARATDWWSKRAPPVCCSTAVFSFAIRPAGWRASALILPTWPASSSPTSTPIT